MGWAKASEIKTEGDSGPNKPSPVNNNNNKKKKQMETLCSRVVSKNILLFMLVMVLRGFTMPNVDLPCIFMSKQKKFK